MREARASLPEGRFVEGVAQALPFADGAFDAAFFSNSLHHVPPRSCGRRWKRHCGCGGPRPRHRAAGGWSLLRGDAAHRGRNCLRQAAQAVLESFVESGSARILRSLDFREPRVFPDVDAFLAKVVAADPARAETAHRLRCRVAALMDLWGTPVEGGLALPSRTGPCSFRQRHNFSPEGQKGDSLFI